MTHTRRGAGAEFVPTEVRVVTNLRPACRKFTLLAVVATNIVWVLGSVAVLIAFSPSALGYAFLISQALAVRRFAELQILALKREPADA